MNLNVKIPKRFKISLMVRYDIRMFNREWGVYVNYTKCVLCETYFSNKGCGSCPFDKFGEAGCFGWMSMVLKAKYMTIRCGLTRIDFLIAYKSKAKSELALLKKAAKKYIEWV